MTHLFDVIVTVDWSASSIPRRGKDSIWQATLDVRSREPAIVNHPTRAVAAAAIRETLIAAAGRRVLVGFDVAYGYPTGFAAALGGGGDGRPPWRHTWDRVTAMVVDEPTNANNRFEVASALNAELGPSPGPFWGCPAAKATPTLSPHKRPEMPVRAGAIELHDLRHTERALHARGRRPFSVWQTAYAGAVGGQTILAIPAIARLVDDIDLAPRSEVWPFTTGLTRDPTRGRPDAVVHAEVWPGVLDLDPALHRVRDAAQMIQLCHHLAALDLTGELGALFDAPMPAEVREVVEREEGWVLGA